MVGLNLSNQPLIPNTPGKIRPYNITKKEWVLNGDTVQYCDFDVILDTLNYDFDKERKFSFIGLSTEQKISHISKFISNV